MTEDQELLTARDRSKAIRALAIFAASLETYVPFDSKKKYSAKQLEPYDALSDGFIRAVESSIRFFRSHERSLYAEYSDSLRDLLNRMHKLDLITALTLWFEMRDLRNRLVHQYLPEQLEGFYALITGPFKVELLRLKEKLEASESQ
jgi:hypothetical protein